MTKQRLEKTPAITILEPTFTEIVVAETGDLQPFLKTFRYAPENASQESLGTMLGVFEIGDRSDTSAYIVNFLASVAKKEYFSQSRRSVTDSLEATLHKINRALAELIKQGNTEWLGTLHAAIGVIDKGTLHFSVTGNGSVVLLRSGFLSVISEGLAPEEAATHPLKTFIEVSSGRLQQQDILLLASPELFEIFTPEDLERAAKRFPPDKLNQFIHTALVNQSPIGGVFMLSFKEITPVPKTKQVLIEKAPVPKTMSINNVFSQNAFHRPVKPSATPQTNILIPQQNAPQSNEYTDDTTGHIYVQGETPNITPPNQQRLEQLEQFFQGLSDRLRPLRHRSGVFVRQSWVNISHSGLSVTRSLWRNTRQGIHSTFLSLRKRLDKKHPPHHKETLSPRSSRPLLTNELANTPSETPRTISSEPIARHFKQITDSIAPFVQNIRSTCAKSIIHIARIGRKTTKSILRHWHTLNQKQRIIASAVLICAILIGGSWLWKIFSTPAPVITETVAPVIPVAPVETNATSADVTPLWQHPDLNAIYPWKGTSFIAVGKQDVSIFNAATNQSESYPIPKENATVLKSAFLSDVQMLIILTDDGSVASFTPANHAWSANNLRFDAPKNITALAGYSTYLYAFDASAQSISRYPRAEGGFGSPVSWFREPVSFQNVTSLSVNTDILIADGSQLPAYTKGKRNPDITFQNSTTPISFDQVTENQTDNSSRQTIVLDTHFGRVIFFDTAGQLTRQFTDQTLRQATGLALDPTTNRILFTTATGLQSFEVQ
jgi:hypothetical protein